MHVPSFAAQINNRGQVAFLGSCPLHDPPYSGARAEIWQDGVLYGMTMPIPNPAGLKMSNVGLDVFINELGEMVGTDGDHSGFLLARPVWRPGVDCAE